MLKQQKTGDKSAGAWNHPSVHRPGSRCGEVKRAARFPREHKCVSEEDEVRRIVTAVDSAGKSFVQSDEQIEDHGGIWVADPSEYQQWADGIPQETIFAPAQPPAGGAIWALAEIEPNTENVGVSEETKGEAIDEHGFHSTRTVDFILVLEGTLTLELDQEKVDASAGDTIVLQAGRHAWRNLTSSTVRFIDVVHSAERN